MSTARKLTLHASELSMLENPISEWITFLERVPKQFFENQPGGENAKKLITAKEAADYLGSCFTVGAIRMKTARQEIPFFKIGSCVYFTPETLEMWKLCHFVAPKLVR